MLDLIMESTVRRMMSLNFIGPELEKTGKLTKEKNVKELKKR